MTNYRRIKEMKAKELAEFLACPFGNNVDYCYKEMYCADCILNWLKSEVKE